MNSLKLPAMQYPCCPMIAIQGFGNWLTLRWLQHPVVMCPPFATFPDSFPQAMLMGKITNCFGNSCTWAVPFISDLSEFTLYHTIHPPALLWYPSHILSIEVPFNPQPSWVVPHCTTHPQAFLHSCVACASPSRVFLSLPWPSPAAFPPL